MMFIYYWIILIIISMMALWVIIQVSSQFSGHYEWLHFLLLQKQSEILKTYLVQSSQWSVQSPALYRTLVNKALESDPLLAGNNIIDYMLWSGYIRVFLCLFCWEKSVMRSSLVVQPIGLWIWQDCCWLCHCHFTPFCLVPVTQCGQCVCLQMRY